MEAVKRSEWIETKQSCSRYHDLSRRSANLNRRVERLESKLDEMHEGFATLGARVAVLETHWNGFDKMK
ncbi:hypothetical protein [Treponema endosymbiont of Eucomonympha sp.]|uniref:hypothetical protein n=1 Tax=Treponema endosymbiont of Eucomonympha sp. TaxID=1580831 RepID=UPI000AC0AEE1|nr:hypothetical protein [Treponema endosymbiont of Eucomonympha sp.]